MKKKTVRNNKGMSLVEVIIAITILGIVVTPVLQAMTSAMTYNAKARVRQKLTLTAESIMETFKGYDLESLVDLFNSEKFSGVDGGTYTAPTQEDIDKQTQDLVFEIEGFKAENGKTYDAVITLKPNGKTTVLEVDNSEGSSDAVYVAKQKDYNSDVYGDLSSAIYNNAFIAAKDGLEAGYVTFYNNFILHPYDNTDPTTELKEPDGAGGERTATIMCDNGTADGLRIGSAADLIDASVEPYVNFKDHIKVNQRVLTIDITKEDGKYLVKASMVYNYSIENFSFFTATYPEKVKDTYLDDETTTESESESESETESTTAVDVSETPSLGDHHYATYPYRSVKADGEGDGDDEDAEESEGGEESEVASDYLVYVVDVLDEIEYKSDSLDRLFIYYYPQYDLDEKQDKIVINNEAGASNLSCYIIKQKNSSLNDIRIASNEKKYIPTVVYNNNSASNVYLYHNLNTNIASDVPGSNPPEFTIPAGFSTDKGGDISKILDVEDEESKTKGFAQDEVLSYDITVEIKDGENVVSSLESSKNERINSSKKAVESGDED